MNAAGLAEPPSAFVEGARAGEDRVGQPVSLVAAAAPARTPAPESTAAADSPEARAKSEGSGDDSARPASAASDATSAASDAASATSNAASAATGGAQSTSSGAQSAQTYSAPDDPAAAFKRGLEERGKPLLAVALDGARRVWVENDEVRVEFAPERKHLHDTLKKAESQKLLREVCCEVLARGVGINIRLRAPAGDEEDEQLAAEDEVRREQRVLRERAEGHPVVQKMLKTFRAEIVEVRRTDPAPPRQ